VVTERLLCTAEKIQCTFYRDRRKSCAVLTNPEPCDDREVQPVHIYIAIIQLITKIAQPTVPGGGESAPNGVRRRERTFLRHFPKTTYLRGQDKIDYQVLRYSLHPYDFARW
jgi:hypothetical protein